MSDWLVFVQLSADLLVLVLSEVAVLVVMADTLIRYLQSLWQIWRSDILVCNPIRCR